MTTTPIRRYRGRATLSVAIAVPLALAAAFVAPAPASGAAAADATPGKVAAWTASPSDMAGPYDDKTVRNIVHLGIAGDQVQIRLSNAFGTVPVTFDSVWLGRQSTGAAIVPGTNAQVQFGGSNSVKIPVGAEVLSDPVTMSVEASQNLAVSVHVLGDTGRVTGHWQAQQSGWYSDGDTAASEDASPYVYPDSSWFWVDAVVVRPREATTAVVALGDSITEGYGSTTDANNRYPNILADRARVNGHVSIINEGLGGNRVIDDAGGIAGVSVQTRLDRDVLSQPNVRTVIFMEGVNDINTGTVTSVSQLIQADKAIIARLHAHGIRVIGGTLTPIGGEYGYDATREQLRSDLNTWIKTSGAFDSVVDFDKATRDPANPLAFLPAFDLGDHLHPNAAGYEAMADAVPLDQLTAPTTTTSQIASPITVGSSGRLSVSVAADVGVPAGSVSVTEGGSQLASQLLTRGSASIDIGSGLAVGDHTLTVSYEGADGYLPSSSTVKLTVVAAPVIPVVTAPASPAPQAATVTTVVITSPSKPASSLTVTKPAAIAKASVRSALKIGKTLAVTRGTYKGASVTVTYRWYRGSSPIAGAAGAHARYTIRHADDHKTLSVKITVTREGGDTFVYKTAKTVAVGSSAR